MMKKKSKQQVPAASLPDDLLESCIVPRLPAKSLIRFQCVSKKWHRLISSRRPKFIQMQSQHAASGLLKYYWSNYKPTYLSTDPASVGINPNIRKCRMISPSRVVASCNGLLCILTQDDDHIYIGNPSLNAWKLLPYQPLPPFVTTDRVFGLAVDVTTMNYNLVVLIPQTSTAEQSEFYIFSSASERWNVVKQTFTLPAGTSFVDRVGVCVKGSSLYWLLNNGHVLRFRLQEELCSIQPPPHGAAVAAAAARHKNIGECDGKFCYAVIMSEEIQMWSMDDSQCWSKRLSVSVGWKLKGSFHKMQLRRRKQRPDKASKVVLMPFESGDSLFFSVDWIMYCYDTLTGEIHMKGNFGYCPRWFPYKNTLVSFPM